MKEEEEEVMPREQKCIYCGIPDTGVFLTLPDGKSYAWVNDCLRNQTHVFKQDVIQMDELR